MIPNDTEMLICPLKDCLWRYERPAPSFEALAAAGVTVTAPVSSIDDLARELYAAEVRHTDQIVRAHLAEHPVEDFLATINDLREQTAARAAKPRAEVLTWDWREQPDLEQLARTVAEVSGGAVHLRQVDTGSDQYAIVIANREVDDAAAMTRYERMLYERT